MAAYVKQVANIYFDDDVRLYRAAVEYFPEDLSKAPVSVPVDFTGDTNLTFAEIRDLAFKAADEVLASLRGV